MSAVAFRWDGAVMRPISMRQVGDRFTPGEVYWLEQGRSNKSHDHEFAWLQEAWEQLPETLSDQFPTPEHLRKRALIDSGFFTEQIIDCGAHAAALRVAAFARGEDEFGYVVTRGPIVVVRKAKSQSRRAMGGAEFQASKTAIIGVVSELLGVTPDELRANAGKAA